MSETNERVDDSEMTLDPPGRIAVIGAGVLGLEAALYGRFLGYDVVVWERASEIGHNWAEQRPQPLPMLPSLSLSGLARAALLAQTSDSPLLSDQSLPLTIGQWVDQGLRRLAATDLLRGRVWTGCDVQAVELIDVDLSDNPEDDPADPDTEIVGEVPADFRLTIATTPSPLTATPQNAVPTGPVPPSLDFEAIILACGTEAAQQIRGGDTCWQSPYCFAIGGAADTPLDEALPAGWQQIVRLYAQLGGRPGLDLYRPRRM